MNVMEKTNQTIKVAGFSASLYMALAYLIGIIIFIFVLQYPSITDVTAKIKIQIEMKDMVFLTNLFLYVLFGPALVLFVINLKTILNTAPSLLTQFSSVIGFLWAGSLTASGMIANGALEPLSDLFQKDPEWGLVFWKSLETVSMGIGNGNGEILGGLMTLGFSLAMLQAKLFPKSMGYFGVIVGTIGIVSLVPALVDITALFGILQLVWFVLVGVITLKSLKKGGEV